MPNFIKDLQKGKLGESHFIRDYPNYRKGGEGYCLHDFVCQVDGHTVELKTDFYDMDKTPNFFLERYSNYKKKTNGGPWRRGAEFFVYYFISHEEYFWFKRQEMLELLNDIKLGKLVRVPNGKYDTMGYKIERELLEEIRIIR